MDAEQFIRSHTDVHNETDIYSYISIVFDRAGICFIRLQLLECICWNYGIQGTAAV